MAKEKKEQRYHNGMAVDSDEEVMALLWFEELMDAGYILKIERAETLELCPPLVTTYRETVQLKTKVKEETKVQKLMEGHVYTPEFKIKLSSSGIRLLSWRPFTNREGMYSNVNRRFDSLFVATNDDIYIEVKPDYDQNNMTRLFKINQKWMFQKYGIFINLIQPHKLFEKTFTPTAWLTTRTGKLRTIHWSVRSLDDYLILTENNK